MTRLTVIPAYGRDYKSKKAVQADFDADKDFMICDISSADDGRYVNRQDLKPGDRLNVRYNGKRSVCEIVRKPDPAPTVLELMAACPNLVIVNVSGEKK